MSSLRSFISIVESADAPGFVNGWWVLPDGRIVPCQSLGSHAITALRFLEEPSENPVEALKGKGGIRCAVFWTPNPSQPVTMNIDLDAATVTEAAKRGLLRLLAQTREDFEGYYFEHLWTTRQDNARRDYREAMAEVRQLRLAESAVDERKPSRAEDLRVFNAYLKKLRITTNDLMRMEDAEATRHWETAMANRHLYAVAKTEPGYLYHGTAKARLPSIEASGLVPSERTRWSRSGMTYNALGRVFFADTVDKAEFYARAASQKNHVFLRVKRSDLIDMKPDVEEEDGCCFYVERRVPPKQIEVWSGKAWMPLSNRTTGK